MDACLPGVSSVFPCRDFLGHQASIVQSAIEALAAHDVDLGFRHVQPTAVFGGVVKLDLVQDPTRLLRPERLVEARSVVGVQVVLHQANLRRTRVMPVHQVADAVSVVLPGAPVGDRDMTPAPQWFAHHELAADPFAFVLVVHDGGRATPGWLRRSHFAEELSARLIEADHRPLGIVREHVGLNHVLHPPDEFGVGLGRDAP